MQNVAVCCRPMPGAAESEIPIKHKMEPTRALIPPERIERAILLIRGQKVLLDRDLAKLYGVTTKALNQTVRRNRARFPIDFMFQLSKGELEEWRSQFVTSNPAQKMGLRRLPYAFTEQGVSMLSNVLRGIWGAGARPELISPRRDVCAGR